MNRNTNLYIVAILLFLLFAVCPPAFSKDNEINPVTVGQSMSDFTLPSYQGGEVTLSGLKGKNVLMIFPRGLSGKARFCAIDNYRYAELMEIEKTQQIREKYNVEILYIFPYNKKIVQTWVEKNPEQLEDIEKWKTPPESGKLTEGRKKSIERTKKVFPKTFKLKKGEVPTPFPILIDADRKVSKGLGIFSTEWGGSKVDQCMSSVFIVDKKGILQLKYIGQNPFDRPSFDYLVKFLKTMSSD